MWEVTNREDDEVNTVVSHFLIMQLSPSEDSK